MICSTPTAYYDNIFIIEEVYFVILEFSQALSFGQTSNIAKKINKNCYNYLAEAVTSQDLFNFGAKRPKGANSGEIKQSIVL